MSELLQSIKKNNIDEIKTIIVEKKTKIKKISPMNQTNETDKQQQLVITKESDELPKMDTPTESESSDHSKHILLNLEKTNISDISDYSDVSDDEVIFFRDAQIF